MSQRKHAFNGSNHQSEDPRTSIFRRTWNQIKQNTFFRLCSKPKSSIDQTPEKIIYYESIELGGIPHSRHPILQINYQNSDGTSKTEFYKPKQARIAIKELIEVLKTSDVHNVRISWPSEYFGNILSALEAQKPKLDLRVRKFTSDTLRFQCETEARNLIGIIQHFKFRTLQIATGNFTLEVMEELMRTSNFKNCYGIALRIPKGVCISNFFHANRLRLTCDYLIAEEVHQLVKNFTTRNLDRGAFFGMYITSGFDLKEMRQLLGLNEDVQGPIISCSLPVRNRHMVLHMKLSKHIAKAVVCSKACVENDFMSAQDIDG